MTKPTLAFAGLGAMGGGMAINLVKNGGFTVHGYDISSAAISTFTSAGGHAATTPREAASHADIFISMVADAAQNTSLLFTGDDCMIKGLKKGGMIMLCSTTAPSFVTEIRKKLDECRRQDVRFIDAPVSGGTIRAADGTLSIFAAGPDSDLDAAAEVLECMSQHLYRISGGISSGMKTKTVHQLLAATNIIAASEVMGVAANVGLNTSAVYDHLRESAAASFMFANRVPHMLESDWHPYSALAIILKDTGIVTHTARSIQFPTPLASCAEQLYLRGVQAGLLRDDDAKLVQLYLPPAQGDLVKMQTEADVMMVASYQISKDVLVDLLAGIHLAAAVEAMAFCKALGMDRRQMCEIVLKAAGSSEVFSRSIPEMLDNDTWTLADCPQAADVGQKLSDAVNKCRVIKVPCPMATTALQQFHFGSLPGKEVKKGGRGR